MSTRTVHLAVYDTFADWETGHTTAHLTQNGFTVRTVGPTTGPVTTMGGVRIQPDLALGELDPEDSALLILTGAHLWDSGRRPRPLRRQGARVPRRRRPRRRHLRCHRRARPRRAARRPRAHQRRLLLPRRHRLQGRRRTTATPTPSPTAT